MHLVLSKNDLKSDNYLKKWDESGIGDAPFPIASCSKYFIAYLCMQLWEQGKLEIFSPIDQYLTELSGCASTIWMPSVMNLLTHTSEIPNLYDQLEQQIDETNVFNCCLNLAHQSLSNKSAADLCRKYSNTNYILLGEILRRSQKSSVSNLMRSNVFDLMGLNTAQLGTTLMPKEMLATPKLIDEVGVKIDLFSILEVDDLMLQEEFTDGNILLTVRDIFALTKIDFGLSLLSERSRNLMTGTSELFPLNFPCGLEARQTQMGQGWGHKGYWLGYQSEFFIAADEEGDSYFGICNETELDQSGDIAPCLYKYLV